jgi:hypothetical protein
MKHREAGFRNQRHLPIAFLLFALIVSISHIRQIRVQSRGAPLGATDLGTPVRLASRPCSS